MTAEYILGAGKDVVEIDVGDDAERYLAVDSTEGHIVDLVSERRDIRPLRRIQFHHQHVLPTGTQVRRDIEAKWRIATLVFAQLGAIDPHFGRGHGSFEVHESAVRGRGGGDLEPAAVGGDKLVRLVVEAMPGQRNIGMRDCDSLEVRVVEVQQMGP